MSDAFDTAEMDAGMARVMSTMSRHRSPEINRIHDHLQALWERPDGFEAGEMIDAWDDDPLLSIVELGVVFGIAYEQAYPTARNDEWPIPVDERPSAEVDR